MFDQAWLNEVCREVIDTLREVKSLAKNTNVLVVEARPLLKLLIDRERGKVKP